MVVHTSIGFIILCFMVMVGIMIAVAIGFLIYDIFEGIKAMQRKVKKWKEDSGTT